MDKQLVTNDTLFNFTISHPCTLTTVGPGPGYWVFRVSVNQYNYGNILSLSGQTWSCLFWQGNWLPCFQTFKYLVYGINIIESVENFLKLLSMNLKHLIWQYNAIIQILIGNIWFHVLQQ